jgi:hypothetical protein
MSNMQPASWDTPHFDHMDIDFTVIDSLATGQTGSNGMPLTKATLTISYPLGEGL